MKNYKLLLVFLFLLLASSIYAGTDTLWVRRYNNSTLNDTDYARAIAIDRLKNVYVTGGSKNTTSIIPTFDYLTIKYDSLGNLVWKMRYNGAADGYDFAQAIALDDSCNVYVTGTSYGGTGTGYNYYTIKYDSSGNLMWSMLYNNSGSSDDRANAIAVDKQGNVYVTGMSYSASSSYDYATVKYDIDGNWVWTKRYNGVGTGSDEAKAIVVDTSGNIYVTGRSFGSSDDYATIKYLPIGDTAWVRRYDGGSTDIANAITVDLSGNVYVTGVATANYYTIKYSSSGTQQWFASYNGSGSNPDEASAIAVDSIGDVFVTGASTGSSGTFDYATIKYNPSGTSLWTSRYNGPSSLEDRATALVLNGNFVYVTGFSTGSTTGFDYATIKYAAATGYRYWIARYSNTLAADEDKSYAVAIDKSGNTYVTGGSYGVGTNLDFATIKYRVVKNVGVDSIVQPRGNSVDSTATIIPRAWVKNSGSETETFSILFKIDSIGGNAYSNTQTVTGLPPDSIRRIDFAAWTVGKRGNYTTRCSTYLASDEVYANDTLAGSFTIIVRNVGTTHIIQPAGNIDSTVGTVVPMALVKNFGTQTETFNVRFTILGGMTTWFDDSVVTIASGESLSIDFRPWTVTRGNYTTRCSTGLVNDMVRANDTLCGSFRIVVHDVGAKQIIQPNGDIDSTATIIPRVKVKNFGTESESFNVRFIIATWFDDTLVTVTAGDSLTIDFNPWTVGPRGSYVTRCSTYLAADMVHSNDTTGGAFNVIVHNVGMVEIIQPTGACDSTATITPMVRVKNFGTQDETFNVTFRVGSWSTTKEVSVLPPDEEEDVTFDDAWTTGPRGYYATKCSTELNTDLAYGNDTLQGSFSIIVPDFGISSVTAPTIIDSGTTIAPKAWIHNYGSTNEVGVPVTIFINGTSLTNTTNVTLNSGDSLEWTFDSMVVGLSRGDYQLRCSTQLNNDIVVSNNMSFVTIRVIIPGWDTLSSLQLISGRGVKAGGALTIVSDTLFALQGGNTKNFYAYNITENTWAPRCTIPYSLRSNGSVTKKKVKAGSALTAYNNIIYAFKGNTTSEFWCYLPGQDTWIAKHSITEIAAGLTKATKVKAGGSLVTAADSIFAFKGGNTNEFWVYDIQQDTWYQRPSLITSDGKKIKAGAALTVKDSIIYAFVGGSTNHFYEYIIPQGTWTKLADVSFGTSSTIRRKIKDGAALTEMNGKIFALKGGNTSDFGYYDIGGNTWNTREIIPGGKVKAGAAMVSYNRQIFTLKGSNTNKFLRYTPSISLPAVSRKSNTEKSIMAGNISPVLYSLVDVKPNPFINSTTISYNVAEPGKVSLKLFAIDGSVIKVLCDEYRRAGSYTIRLAGDGLAKGIYFLKYNDSLTNTEIKVIVR